MGLGGLSMKSGNLSIGPAMTRLEKETRLRLFYPLHQDDSEYEFWYRASGTCVCSICGLQYRDHPTEEYRNIDHRLCNGDIVHL